MIILIADIVSAIAVLTALYYIPKYKNLWILYGLGCLVFVFINFYKELPGQACMNLFAMGIAIRNWNSED